MVRALTALPFEVMPMFKPGMRVGDTVQVGDTQKIIIEVLPGGYILQDAEAEAEPEEQITKKRKAKA